jgi:hypothetical protein
MPSAIEFNHLCSFCKQPVRELTSSFSCCPPCDMAISVVGRQPIGVAREDYESTVREVAGIVAAVPQHRGEKFLNYKCRIMLCVEERRSRRIIPLELMKPLSDAAVKSAEAGDHLIQIIAANKPPAKTLVAPEAKKGKFERANEKPVRSMKPDGKRPGLF